LFGVAVNKKLLGLMLIVFLLPVASNSQAIIADHNSVLQFETIPESVILLIRNNYHIFYGHTSHGSQIITGIEMLADEDPLYTSPYIFERSGDLGHNGDTAWVPKTRIYLDDHPETDVVMWSWCWGVSDNTEEGINIYLNKYSQLEAEYPTVKFVYMTGHLDGTGVDGNLYAMNNLIREYCATNGKILFDFADIESYDPAGNYYPDDVDLCNWCSDWCATHTCPDCNDYYCMHSHCFNCYQKGKAFWWMMAKITGWGFESGDCGDVTGDGIVNLLDISFLISFLYLGGPSPYPLEIGDVNSSGNLNLLDVTYLIIFLYAGGPAPDCPE
jgi:hypothetical protein